MFHKSFKFYKEKISRVINLFCTVCIKHLTLQEKVFECQGGSMKKSF